jgi:hypothetical protein
VDGVVKKDIATPNKQKQSSKRKMLNTKKRAPNWRALKNIDYFD